MRRIGLLALSFAFLATAASADDSWYCSEVSSQRVGNEIHACGTGASPDESEARLRAFDSAKEEFKRICEASEDCRGHVANADPKRTTCEKQQGDFRCRRLVVFTVGAKSEETAEAVAATSSSQAPLPPAGTTPTRATASSVDLPKIEKGISKSKVLARFGEPASVQEVDARNLILHFQDPAFCDGVDCTVVLFDGRVDHYFGFRVRNTGALDDESFLDKLRIW